MNDINNLNWCAWAVKKIQRENSYRVPMYNNDGAWHTLYNMKPV